MKFIVAFLICAMSFSALAQMDSQKMLYLHKVEKFRRMRSLGLVMVVVGTGMAVTGFSRLTKATYSTNSSGQATSSDPSAAYLFLGGAPFFGGGVPLAIIGHKKMKQYEKKLISVSFNFQPMPRQQGLVLTYRF